MSRFLNTLFVCATVGTLAAPHAVRADCPECVVVAVDLDSSQPGFQTTLSVAPGTTLVEDVAIWIYDPNETAVIQSIGFVGGLNRGIAFGHVPDDQNTGTVTALSAETVEPVVDGNGAWLNNGIQPMFAGPEVQYFETGAPGTIGANPANPVLTVDIELDAASEGDVFLFHVGDMTAAWLESGVGASGGAFSTADVDSLDAGGDAVPDGTVSLLGTDADVPAPSPPAPFQVDYQDGGGALIMVSAAGVPTASTWSLLVMTALLMLAGARSIRRARATT